MGYRGYIEIFNAGHSAGEDKHSKIVEYNVIGGEIRHYLYAVSTGDEFISSLIGNTMKERIMPANDFVFRFWTGTYRSISEKYKTTLVCLHVPAEKGTGMISLFDRYICKGRIPPREKVWKMLHISRRGAKVAIITVAKKMLKR